MALLVRELTPRGVGAVSVLEVVGEGALDAVSEIARPAVLKPGQLRILRLSDAGEDLDEAICLVVDPHRVELHLHGSPVLLERVVRALGGAGLRESETRGLEEEARALLSGARSEAAARILLDQVEGALSRRLEELALLDEDAAQGGLVELLRDSHAVAPVLVPPRVVLAGPTNSGKSTLFNALVGSERAITCAEPGTTRDLVIGYASLDEIVYELVDTAGEREIPDEAGPGAVERAGQRAAQALRERAEVVFWLECAGDPHEETPDGFELLKTHSDQLTDPPEGAISALTNPLGARTTVSDRLRRSLNLDASPWVSGRGVLFTPPLRAWGEGVLADSNVAVTERLYERSRAN